MNNNARVLALVALIATLFLPSFAQSSPTTSTDPAVDTPTSTDKHLATIRELRAQIREYAAIARAKLEAGMAERKRLETKWPELLRDYKAFLKANPYDEAGKLEWKQKFRDEYILPMEKLGAKLRNALEAHRELMRLQTDLAGLTLEVGIRKLEEIQRTVLRVPIK